MAASLTETLLLTSKRLCRGRYKRSHLLIGTILILMLCTFYLISYLPSGADRVNVRRSRPYNAEALESRGRLHLEDQIPDVRPVAHIPVNGYGDEWALFTDSKLGNYELRTSPKRGRPGDGGRPYRISERKDVDWARAKSLKSQYGMNIAASEFVPMDRTVPDLRLDECKHWNYSEKLPSASVVIVFHNEGFTTLMRTVHSVLVRSPKRFLKEVILVDDFSEKKPLKEHLEKYIENTFGPYKTADLTNYESNEGMFGEKLGEKSGKVRLIRNSERGGLIRSRSRGAREAVGDVIIFLDAHCEVNYNWLPPLLAPIGRNRKTLTVPIIDGIDSETFEYRPVYARKEQHYKGIWEWGMYYKEIEVDMQAHLQNHKVSEPYDAPTHAGGLFAIDRKYFLELGTYDPGLLVWGGENFELSFKVWQCGGQLQWVPCSRVGHVYRPFMPYSFGSLANQRKGPLIITNYKRVIEVWWDQKYKDYFYTREPLATFYEAGDISEQLAMKKRLKCKSFDYFMDRVGKDVYKNFPPLPANVHWGELRSKAMTGMCVDMVGSAPPQTAILSSCHGTGGNQLLRLNEQGQIGVGERCVNSSGGKLTLIFCKLGTVDGPWEFEIEEERLRHKSLDKCLTFDREDEQLKMASCGDDITQKFMWKKIRPRGF